MQSSWRNLTFLHTYQGPLEARVLDLARQVRDIAASPALESPVPTKFLAIGDRDYRTDRARRAALRDRNASAKSDAYKLDFRLVLWEENEIENYLLDREAILRLLDAQAAEARQVGSWRKLRKKFVLEWCRLLGDQRELIWERVADRIQHEDRRLGLAAAMDPAREQVLLSDENLAHWCDAKTVLSNLRSWLQERGFPSHLTAERIIEHMTAVPADIQKTLRLLRQLSSSRRRSRTPP